MPPSQPPQSFKKRHKKDSIKQRPIDLNQITEFILRHDPSYFQRSSKSNTTATLHAHTVKPLELGGKIKPELLLPSLKRVKKELAETDKFNYNALCNDDSEVRRLYEELPYKLATSNCHLELMRSKRQKTTAAMTAYLNYPVKPFQLHVLLSDKYWEEHAKLGGSNSDKLITAVDPNQPTPFVNQRTLEPVAHL